MRPAIWLVALYAVATPAAWSTPAAPVAASPGSVSSVSLVEARCPTFSWGQVEGARSYELVVYQIGEDGQVDRPALRQSLPGSLGSWTPALDRCLDHGQRYGWAVRAHSARAETLWSETLLFEIASRPTAMQVDEALAVLREYLAMPAARALVEPAAGARQITTQEEEAALAGSAAVEPRVVPTTTGLQLALGAYQGGTANSVVAGHTKQMIIAGEYDMGPNSGSSVKLLISDYDNDTTGGADIYPIYVEDENNNVDFYVRKQAGVASSAYFGGDLRVQGQNDAALTAGGYLVLGPIDGHNLALDENDIMARNNGVASTLRLNKDGGDVVVGGVLDIGYEIITSTDTTNELLVYCPLGSKVLGGGCASLGGVWASFPEAYGEGWWCATGVHTSVTGYAVCARVLGEEPPP